MRPDPVEIAEARWFAMDELPGRLGSEVERILDLLYSRTEPGAYHERRGCLRPSDEGGCADARGSDAGRLPADAAHIRCGGCATVHPDARDRHADARTAVLCGPSFGEVSERVDRLARVLARLGVEPGDRVGTFAWNNQRHFELYMAIPCVGAVLHTLNVRLFAEQLTYIVNHAEDQLIFVDDSLVPLLEKLAPQLPGVRHYVVMGDGEAGSLPGALRYEELLAEAGAGAFDYPELDERQAAALCYTSGTTGNPKGVLYSHRSICLHSTASLMTDALGLSRRDRALVVVPMFHANAWGIPHGAALAGSDLIMPDRFLQAEPLAGLIEAERPTVMGCVPTIFADLLRYAEDHDVDLSSLTNAACGGSAVPRQLMKDFQERHDVRVFQAWGMTETSPVATYSRPR